jgi:chromosome partitioning protein
MIIITVGNQKGGVGKSTISDNLAVIAATNGLKVLLIDSDTQGSSMAFRGLREKNDIKAISITAPTIHKDIKGFAGAFDVCFIDAGGRDSAVFRSAIMSCDLLLIPVLPSQYDIFALSDTVNILKEARTYKDIPGYLCLNQMLHANISGEAQEAIEEISKENDLKIFNSTLFSRVAFKNSISSGQGVIEWEPKGKAAGEIKSLYAEIMKEAKTI